MDHIINNALATRLGINAALVADFLWEETENRFSPEHTWFRFSHKMFTVEFPYISERTIRRTMKRLTDKGILKKCEHNASAFDRTLSYKFTDFGESIMHSCIGEIQIVEVSDDES